MEILEQFAGHFFPAQPVPLDVIATSATTGDSQLVRADAIPSSLSVLAVAPSGDLHLVTADFLPISLNEQADAIGSIYANSQICARGVLKKIENFICYRVWLN